MTPDDAAMQPSSPSETGGCRTQDSVLSTQYSKSRADVFVSVVAVLRSYARFLPAFVGEVCRTLDEHYTNFELVLVDNGSRDDTPAV
ncbi:MAG TPA: hypothetical protein VKE74_36510, partial [Gemmataceae bacterium]|nr:hypothetical protein [Gemmataceae bacterium]